MYGSILQLCSDRHCYPYRHNLCVVKSGRVQFHRRVSSGIRSDEPDGDAEQYDSECSHSDIQRDTYGRGHLFERGIHGERGG